MPTPQKLAISISDSQLDLETEIDPDWERLIGSPRFEAAMMRKKNEEEVARRPQSSSSASVTRSTTDLGKPARPQTSSGEKPPVA